MDKNNIHKDKRKERIITFDVMQNNYYVCTLKMPCPTDRPVTLDELALFVVQKRPTLRYVSFSVITYDGVEMQIEWKDRR